MANSAHNREPRISRRRLVKEAGVAAAGWAAMTGRAAHAAKEALALDGGPKAVRYSAEQQRVISKWPRYGELDKQGVLQLLETNEFYEQIALLEAVCRDYHKVPHAKAHCKWSGWTNETISCGPAPVNLANV